MSINYNRISNIKSNGSLKPDIILLGIYFILAPFEQLLNFGPGTVLKFIAGLFVLLGLTHLSKRIKSRYFTDPIIRSISFLIVISFLSILWSVDVEVSKQISTTCFLLQLVFIFVYIRKYSLKDQIFIKRTILFGGIAVFVYLFILFPETLYGNDEVRAALRKTDPNEFAALLILPLFIAFGEFLTSKNYIYLILFSIFLYLILLTGSRGAMLSIFLIIAYYAIQNFKLKTVVNIIIIAIIFFLIILPLLPEAISQRLWGIGAFSNDFNTKDTRVDIWMTIYAKVMPDFSFFGNGAGSGGIILAKYFGQKTGVHNTYLSLIIDYGVLGLPVFIYLLLKIFKIIKKENDYAKILSFISILIIVFFLDAMFKKYLWNVLMYCTISVSIIDYEYKNKKNSIENSKINIH